jgi:hypothetical protein
VPSPSVAIEAGRLRFVPLTHESGLGVSYQYNSFAFGSARMASFVLTFGFR